MKRNVLVGAALLLTTACGSSNSSPSSPSSTLPTTITFTAALNPANEVPPVTNADATGSGTATVTFHLTRDAAGTITAATTDFVYSLSGFPNGTSLILTHVHTGGPGIAGSPVINSGLTAANAIAMPNGTLTNQTFSNLATDVTVAQQMIDNPNGYYFNVHTTINAGGAARGQLVKQ